MWKWSYRSTSGTDTYTTCWEADVMATRLQRDSVLHRRGLSTNQASRFRSSLCEPFSDSLRMTILNRPPPWEVTGNWESANSDLTCHHDTSVSPNGIGQADASASVRSDNDAKETGLRPVEQMFSYMWTW